MRVKVIGAGLAGCEAAWQLAESGASVTLYEMKPLKYSDAHHNPDFAELVCSNSLRAAGIENAVGLLKEEMRRLGSLVIGVADRVSVPAGGALAVDREAFSKEITRRIKEHPLIETEVEEVKEIPDKGYVIVATGPLTSEPLARHIEARLGSQGLSFFDAAAPIVSYDSLDLDKVYLASRYDKGTPDYINCPMNKDEYDAFYDALVSAEEAQLKDFDIKALKVFEGCMPIEVMARRGRDALRFGPMKPVGLRNPRTGELPYAVVQLRRDNAAGSLYNIVGFQTHLTFPEQKRVFRMIPGLERAEFVRYGVMHRNTYLDSPRLLDSCYRLKKDPRIFFAGQMTGVEGYVESAASGLLAGRQLARIIGGKEPQDFTNHTAIGALAAYISDENVKDFQPMNINFGLIAPIEGRFKHKRDKNAAIAARALDKLQSLISE